MTSNITIAMAIINMELARALIIRKAILTMIEGAARSKAALAN